MATAAHVLAFLSPWIAGFSIFFGYPLVMTGYLSFTHYDLLNPPRWIGLANYRYMLGTDDQIWSAGEEHAVVHRRLGAAAGAVRARDRDHAHPREGRGRGLPHGVLPSCARARRSPRRSASSTSSTPPPGPVNTLLGKIGIDGPLWFNDPNWAKPSLVMLSLWGVGNIMIIFLAAVLDVPRHLYESADLDGARTWQRFRWVTLPLVSPVILFSVVLGVIQGLQYFTQAYVAASVAAGQASQAGGTSTLELGYPEGSTLFYPILLYYHGFHYFDMGYASAMAALLLVVAFALTVVIIHGSRRFVHYQGAAR